MAPLPGTAPPGCIEQPPRGETVAPASKPMIGKDGTALRDAEGYSPIVSFDSKDARDRLNGAVLDALRLAQPEVFADAEGTQ